MTRISLRIALLALLLLAAGAPLSGSANPASRTVTEYDLNFDPSSFSLETTVISGQTITYRAYKNIVYVKHPVDAAYQNLNLYIPVEYFEGKSIGPYNAKTAPIFLPNTVGGYMPALPCEPGLGFDGKANAALTALSNGYVVAAPGARGRTTQNENGLYTGKAPACIIDLKAAVRYLRYNQKHLPGDIEKIISNGTSAGGALSALLGASGNSRDYEPYLAQLGAAETRDDIFAASCYCPITDLDHADMAYEWLFNGIKDYKKMAFPEGTMPSPGHPRPPLPPGNLTKPFELSGSMTDSQMNLSDELKPQFTSYLNGLQLKQKNGELLTLASDGNGNFKDYVKSFVIESAQTALNQGTDLSGLTWLAIENGQISDIDFDAYIRYAGRMKTTPAFDDINLSSGENSLFGTPSVDAQHFTQFASAHSTANLTLADPNIVKMMNPLNYIGQSDSTSSPYWRIRHGAIDRDTAVAIPIILTAKLDNSGAFVDFALPWNKGHSGDYDLPELFAWIDQICKMKQ